jgi:hypothetical protein
MSFHPRNSNLKNRYGDFGPHVLKPVTKCNLTYGISQVDEDGEKAMCICVYCSACELIQCAKAEKCE